MLSTQNKKSHGKRTGLFMGMITLALVFFNTTTHAQVFCTDEVPYWTEDFGTGTTAVSHPDALTPPLSFQLDGILTNEGSYRVINSSQQRPEWHNAEDHTPNDLNGRMMVVNGVAGDFFRHVTNRPAGFLPGSYSASLYLLNANTPGTCAPNPLLPNIRFSLEYQDQNGNWVGLQNSPVSSNPVGQSANPAWIVLGAVFNLPPTGAFLVTNLRVTLNSLSPGGCGNDFAIDDIKLASCPSGGPVPVLFEKIQARVKGTGILVSWQTAQEVNNDRFEVERSSDEGRNWTILGEVDGAGNSQVRQYYQWMDNTAKPGLQLYRVRQVDWDGQSKYSSTVQATLKAGQSVISILNNPASEQVTLQFLSDKLYGATIRLLDASGRKTYSKNIRIPAGPATHTLPIPSALKGLYIVQIIHEEGRLLFAEKIMIQ